MKVLILAYDFPPYSSVGGLRPYSWFRYLKNFDVVPVVVTRQWENRYGDERDYIASSPTARVVVEESDFGTIIRTPYAANWSNRRLLRRGSRPSRIAGKLITAGYEVSQYFATVGPRVQLFRAAQEYLRATRVDAIIATGEPFVLFRYAALLSREFRVPWIADYRDPWSQDKRRPWPQRVWESPIERQLVKSASAITTVSDFMCVLLNQLHPGRAPLVVSNGYDPEAIAVASGTPQGRDQFSIAFAGSVYDHHPVESVFRVFDAFIQRTGANFSLNLIGVGGRERLEEMLASNFPHLAPRVTFTGRLANEQMAVAMARANAFLMFNMYAYSGTKIFDYVALKRRILLCYSDDPDAKRLKQKYYNVEVPPGASEHVLEKMVEDTRSGVVVKDASHLAAVLHDLYREFEQNGSVRCEPVDYEKFSRRGQAGRLADIIKGIST